MEWRTEPESVVQIYFYKNTARLCPATGLLDPQPGGIRVGDRAEISTQTDAGDSKVKILLLFYIEGL